MKIQDEHLYHGAALIQIAEDARFTAINALTFGKAAVPSAYKINDSIGVYFKYALKPTDAYGEYVFSFKGTQIQTIRRIATLCAGAYIALVCVKDREVCVISADELSEMIEARQKAAKKVEDQYVVLVTAEARKSLRVYMNQPGKRRTILGRERVVSRNDFPAILFD